MRRLFFAIFASLLNFAAANAYQFTMHLDGLERKGNDVEATFTLSYKGEVTGTLFVQEDNNSYKTNEYRGQILVFGTDGTQFLTSSLCQGSNSLAYGGRVELPEDIGIKLTLTIYNVPKTDTELAAIEIKGLLAGENGYDEEDGKSRPYILFWNLKEDKESLQIR